MTKAHMVWNTLLILILGAASARAQPASETEFRWTNPLDFSYTHGEGAQARTVSELRDPAVIREGDTYYLTFTHFPFTHSSSLDAGKPDNNSSPGIPLYSSKDLKKWTFENWLVKSSELPDDCPYKHRFWAPEIHKINGGKVGSYVAFVGVANKVTGPYEHITWLAGAGCDSSLFADDDGKTYAVMPFGDEFIQEVDLRGIDRGEVKLVGERSRIVARDNSDVGKKTSPDYMEGPWMIKRNGKYVLFTASPYRWKQGESAEARDLPQGYWVGAAVADHVLGPYKKEPQVFLGGHISVFTGPGGTEWLSYRGESGGKAQGRLCIDPIPFNADGSVQRFSPSVGTTR